MKEYSPSQPPQPEQSMTKQEAMERILLMRYELQVRGNIDEEHAIIEAIVSQMNAGKISPQDAANKVHELMESRNDR